MVDFNLYISFLSLLFIFDFRLYHSQNILFHDIRRNQQFFELHRKERFFYETEHIRHILYNSWGGRHQHAIRIDSGVSFVKVPGSDAGNVASATHLHP